MCFRRIGVAMAHHRLSSLALLAGLALISSAAAAECFFVGLRGFEIEKNPDVLVWGDISPLIALEAGRFYSLAPERMGSISVNAGQVSGLQGQLYYIPQALINGDGLFALRMMVVDPDKDTADDTLLPLSERSISLVADQFDTNARRVSVRFLPFADVFPPTSNAMRFEFEVRRRPGICDQDSEAGRAADLRLRQRNELQRLLVRVVAYEQPQLVGGREYLAYRRPQIKAKDRVYALERAFDVADVNARELVALGQEIFDLRNTPGFDEVWEEYTLLVQRLARTSIELQFKQGESSMSTSVPSLAFHPKWKQLDHRADWQMFPQAWGISLPDG